MSFNPGLTKIYWYFQEIIERLTIEQKHEARKLMVRNYSQISPSVFENIIIRIYNYNNYMEKFRVFA